MAPGAWFRAEVDWGRLRAVVSGYEDHTFRGDLAADRRTTVDMVWALMASPGAVGGHGFSDVAAGDPAVGWAATAGVVTGYSDGTFRPGAPVTRAQAVMMLWKVAGRPSPTGPLPFTDVRADDWHADGLSWAAAEGIVNGYPDGTFRGEDSVSRAQLTAQISALAHTRSAWAPGTAIPRTVDFTG